MLTRILTAGGIIGATAFISFWLGVFEERRRNRDERIAVRLGEKVRKDQDAEQARVWN